MSHIHSKPTILIIAPTPPPFHGVSVMTQILLDSPLKSKFNLVHINPGEKRGISFVGSSERGTLDAVKIITFLKTLYSLMVSSLRWRPDIVYITISISQLGAVRDIFCLLWTRILGTQSVVHLHGSGYDRFYMACGRIMRIFLRFSIGHASAGIVLGEHLRSCLTCLLPPERVHIVPNGLPDTMTFSTTKPSEVDGIVRILHLSTLARSKGFLEILKAAPVVINEFSTMHLIFAGNFYKQEDSVLANNLIQHSNLQGVIEFTGPVFGEDKESLLQKADIFVFTPLGYEGLPLVLLEAMRAGLPVITTDWGAIPEVVINGRTGIILNDKISISKSLSEAILKLCQDPSLRRRMGEAGRRRFLKYYRSDIFAARMEEVFI